ncbi:ribosomal maturation YjgA family protein [Seonamhaeicola marinus]|uniref:DUF2809 domain-containing protein n=1 Tax=Seonamhaeicola marinus TaxID=1912246 RepID=A0A5D0ITG3_9FLAO|nr:DUF2809 domain-containing protein [Seonamhaeicola marinus]TYA86806.1 DUF2809 domain-containing protein [Seonamhaeicola marinus]
MILSLSKNYKLLTFLLFLTEVSIACFIKTGFIRHTLGDYLVVILLYCFIKIFIEGYSNLIAIGVLVFSFIIEFLQLFNVLDYLNIQNNIIRIILGTTFQTTDLVAYTLGILTILIIENSKE